MFYQHPNSERSIMYTLSSPADAEVFVPRMVHAIARKMPVTITYREHKKLPDGTKSKTEFETVTRTVEPYDIVMSKAGHPLLKAIDRADGIPKSFRMERITHYSAHRSARLMQHAY